MQYIWHFLASGEHSFLFVIAMATLFLLWFFVGGLRREIKHLRKQLNQTQDDYLKHVFGGSIEKAYKGIAPLKIGVSMQQANESIAQLAAILGAANYESRSNVKPQMPPPFIMHGKFLIDAPPPVEEIKQPEKQKPIVDLLNELHGQSNKGNVFCINPNCKEFDANLDAQLENNNFCWDCEITLSNPQKTQYTKDRELLTIAHSRIQKFNKQNKQRSKKNYE
jgi:hypothetical protein